MADDIQVDEQSQVFIVVYRDKGSEGLWKQHNTWTSRSGRPYRTAGIAKGIARKLAKTSYYGEKYDFAVRRGAIVWDEDVIV